MYEKHQTQTSEVTTNYKVFGACILLALNPNRLRHDTRLNGPKDVVTALLMVVNNNHKPSIYLA
jgi:hypothetical protein